MKKGTIIIAVVLIVIGLILGSVIGKYNSMVDMSEDVDAALSNIDTQLQRRSDLIPNLVETVKGYMTYEESVIQDITDARAKLNGASTLTDKAEANDELTTALNNLTVVVENYPDLKASEEFTNLMDELAGTENRITVARKAYNDEVKEYNAYIKKFPQNIIAGMFNYEAKDYFEAADGAEEVPQVTFE